MRLIDDNTYHLGTVQLMKLPSILPQIIHFHHKIILLYYVKVMAVHQMDT